MMEKMKKMVPELRFPEFSGEWVEKRLGDITMWASGGTPSKDIPHYWEGDIPWITASSMRGMEYSDSELKITKEGLKNGSRLAKQGSLLILVRGSMLFKTIPVGITTKDVSFNQDVKSITVDLEYNTRFVLYWFYASESYILDLVTGTGIGAGKIDLADLKNILVSTPSYHEQKKIASFLTSVDEKLQNLKKKKTLLEQYKKGVMQQIFSQVLRFKDENGNEYLDWEEKTLGDVSNVKRGASPRPITSPVWFSEYSNIGWVRISDVTKSNKYLNKTEQYLSKEGVRKSRLVRKGNLIMSICATIGKPIYVNFDVCIHDGFIVFDELKLDKEYLYYYLDMIKLKWYQYGQPGTQVNLNSEIVSNEVIPVPIKSEQTKIANFLSAIDEKITLCNTQIEKTEQYKKGLLQQMFC